MGCTVMAYSEVSDTLTKVLDMILTSLLNDLGVTSKKVFGWLDDATDQ